MSVKKLLVLSAATLAAIGATAAIAGGPDHMVMPVEPMFQNSIYLEGHAGYAQSNWANNNTNRVIGQAGTAAVPASLFTPTSNGNGAFAGGADLGYNITQNIAVEAGWMYLPKVSATGTGFTIGGLTSTTAMSATVKSWFAYTAAKLSVPLCDNFDLFGKVGVAYRALNYSYSSTVPAGVSNLGLHGSYWSPVFGAGLQYNWMNWIFGAQYMFLPSNDQTSYVGPIAFGAPNSAPSVNLYTGFLGYKFNV